jgi:hypothetical protein
MIKIKDSYCFGYFGRRYDLYGADIIDENNYSITVRTTNGEIITAGFNHPDEKEEMKSIMVEDRPVYSATAPYQQGDKILG